MTAAPDDDLDLIEPTVQTGVVHSVTLSPLGSALVADVAAGATTLVVSDVSDFDELDEGQIRQLQVAGVVYDYTTVDPDAETIEIPAGLAADAFDGDRVDLWDTARAEAAIDGSALVAMPGALGSDDFIPAEIAQALLPQFDVGVRDPDERESVTMTERAGVYKVTDVHGKKPEVQPQYGGSPKASALPRVAIVWGVDATIMAAYPTDGRRSNYDLGPISWGIDEDQSSGVIRISDNDGGIYFNAPGVYAVSMFLKVTGIQAANPACSIQAFIDIADPFVSGFGVGARGGDCGTGGSPLPSTCRVYYDPGNGRSGGIFPGLMWANLDTANVTDITVEIFVQQLVAG